MKIHFVLPALWAAVLTLPVAAQLGEYSAELVWPPTSTDDILFPTGSPDPVLGPYRSIEAGDITADGELDAILVAGSDVHIVFRLSQLAHSERIVTGASSAVCFPLGGAGTTPVVVTSTAAGLENFRYVDGTGFVALPLVNFQPALRNVPAMVLAELDGVFRPEVVTISPVDPGKVQAWSLGVGGLFELEFTIVNGSAVEQVLSLDTDEDGIDELAVRTDSEVRIYDSAGVLVALWAAPSTGGTIAVIDATASQPKDRLAWVRPNATGTRDELVVLHPDVLTQVPLPLEFQVEAGGDYVYVDVASIATGDSDADGDIDLVLMPLDFEAAIVVANVGGVQPNYAIGSDDYRLLAFDDDPLELQPSGPPAPLFVDLDDDGDAELIAPFESADRLVFSDLTPGFGGGDGPETIDGTTGSVFDSLYYGYDELSSTPLQGPLVLHLDIDPDLLTEYSFTHLQVQLWRQPDSTTLIEADGLTNGLLEIPSGTTSGHLAFELDLGEGLLANWIDGRHFYVCLRLVEYDTSTETFGPKTIWVSTGLTLDPDLSDTDEVTYRTLLLNSPYSSNPLDLTDVPPIVSGEGEGGGGGSGSGTGAGSGSGGTQQANGVTLGLSVDLGRVGTFQDVPRPPSVEVDPPTTSPLYFWDTIF